MRKLCVLLTVLVLVLATAGTTLAASSGSVGPAPNAGDGVSDGSGLEAPNGANGSVGSGSGPVGPAPDSGDGVPDGSGF